MDDMPSIATQRSGMSAPIRSVRLAADDMQGEGYRVRKKIPHKHVGDCL